MVHETLEQLGLEKREIDIYLALLQLGPASIRDVANESGVNRGSAYEILKKLKVEGMVSYFPKGKRKLFQAEPPTRLLELAEERRKTLNESISQLKSEVIPNLNLLVPSSLESNVSYYEGDDGIEMVLKDILNCVEKSKERSYAVYSSKLIRKHLYRPFPNYTKQRVAKNIRVQVIALGDGGEDAPLAERKWIKTSKKDSAAS